MAAAVTESYVAECFWPAVTEADLWALDEWATTTVAELGLSGETVRYLGSILMKEDEVVLCLFDGTAEGVRSAVERAHVPFDRLIPSTLARPGSNPT